MSRGKGKGHKEEEAIRILKDAQGDRPLPSNPNPVQVSRKLLTNSDRKTVFTTTMHDLINVEVGRGYLRSLPAVYCSN